MLPAQPRRDADRSALGQLVLARVRRRGSPASAPGSAATAPRATAIASREQQPGAPDDHRTGPLQPRERTDPLRLGGGDRCRAVSVGARTRSRGLPGNTVRVNGSGSSGPSGAAGAPPPRERGSPSGWPSGRPAGRARTRRPARTGLDVAGALRLAQRRRGSAAHRDEVCGRPRLAARDAWQAAAHRTHLRGRRRRVRIERRGGRRLQRRHPRQAPCNRWRRRAASAAPDAASSDAWRRRNAGRHARRLAAVAHRQAATARRPATRGRPRRTRSAERSARCGRPRAGIGARRRSDSRAATGHRIARTPHSSRSRPALHAGFRIAAQRIAAGGHGSPPARGAARGAARPRWSPSGSAFRRLERRDQLRDDREHIARRPRSRRSRRSGHRRPC